MNIDFHRRLSASMQPEFSFWLSRVIEEIEPFCESEIEKLLGATILASLRLAFGERVIVCKPEDEGSRPVERVILIIPQYRFLNYRIDFAMRITRPEDLSKQYVFIECDGHDFHERTKEQAARDRKRDREIQTAGFPLLRFTGSEIYRDPTACVSQINVLFRAIRDRAKGEEK